MRDGPNYARIENTLILRRIYDAPVARVWRAWTDPKEFGRWYVAGADHIVHFCEADIRVGGGYRIGFGPPGKTPYVETGHYTEIVPMRRLCFGEMVTHMDDPLGGSECRVELRDLGDGRTELVLTTTGASVWRSGEGWEPCLENLAAFLEKSS
ncbi:MAG TPA: SRPBCC domain-containing protein [Rhizomicrobium sp.]|nr:SRPBCC domain-containing protein [Rhizomicrobium sp.]